jgi:hypothetical protein
MVITTDDVIKYVNAFTFLSCQTAAESTASTNTNADILYTSQSSNQGNFLLFYGIADSQITSDLAKNSITMSDVQKLRAYAYLIQHLWEMKFKDWDAKEISINNDTVVKGVAGLTSGMAAYNELIAEIIRAGSSSVVDTGIVKHADDTYYPSEFKDVPFDDVEMDVI